MKFIAIEAMKTFVPTFAFALRRKIVACGVTLCTILVACTSELLAAEKVLILLPTVERSIVSVPGGGTISLEEKAALDLGFEVDLVTGSQWGSLTPAQFSSYRAIILGDKQCTETGGTDFTAAEQNYETWGPSVTGNIIIIGTDPVYHYVDLGDPLKKEGARKLIAQGIAFAAAQPAKTGYYVSLSCAQLQTVPNGTAKLLAYFGAFNSFHYEDCGTSVHIVSSHPVLDSISDSDLSAWQCSVHHAFDIWPTDSFQPLAIAVNNGSSLPPFPDGSRGYPYVLARGGGLRTTSGYLSLAVDGKDNVWISGPGKHQKFTLNDPITGEPVAPSLGTPVVTVGKGGFGDLIDKLGRLWSAKPNSGLVRIDGNGANIQNYNGIDSSPPPPFGFGDYNIGLDPVTGDIWSARNGDPIVRFPASFSPNDHPFKYQFPQPGGASFPEVVGLAVDNQGNVWLANPDGVNRVTHLRTDGTIVGWVNLPCTQSPKSGGPRGIAVDANGKLWVPDFIAGKVFRIDPDAGPIAYDETGDAGGRRAQRLGAVDTTVDLGADAFPDAYSDMAGMVSAVTRPDSGTWTVVHDSGASRTWQKISWTQVLAANTELKVQVRAAGASNGKETELLNQNFTTVAPSSVNETVVRNLASISGRFLEIKVTMTRLAGAAAGATPLLKDLSVSDTVNLPPLPAENQTPLAQPDFVTIGKNAIDVVVDVLKNDRLRELKPEEAHITAVSPAGSGTVRITDDSRLGDPTEATGGEAGAGVWASGYSHSYRVYAYRIVSGVRYYSSGHVDVTLAPVMSGGVSIEWAGVNGANGYRVLKATTDPVNSMSYNYYRDVPNSDLTDTAPGQWTLGGLVNPKAAGPAGSSLRYTPRPGFFGKDQFTYTVEDSHGAVGDAIVEVEVLPLDITTPGLQPPIATDDVFPEFGAPAIYGNSGATTMDVIANDCFSAGNANCGTDRDKIVLLSVGQPRHGVAHVIDCNKVEYTPAPYFVGTDTFVYLISNGSAEPREATVSVTVQGDPPQTLACGDPMPSRVGSLTAVDMLSRGRSGHRCDAFYLNALPGKKTIVTLTSSGFAPRLAIKSSSGVELFSQEGTSGVPLTINSFTPRETGPYLVEVSTATSAPGASGTYTLTWSCQSMWVKVGGDGVSSGDGLDFGTTTAGQPVPTIPITVLIGNDGTAGLTIQSLGITPASPLNFGLAETSGGPFIAGPLANFTIAPGATKQIFLKYIPAAAGTHSGSMSFVTAGFGTFTLALSGRANLVGQSPIVDITSPAANHTYVSPQRLQVLATATVPGSTIASVQFFVRRLDQNPQTQTSLGVVVGPAADNRYVIEWNSPIVPGNYVLTALATATSPNNRVTLSSPVLVHITETPTPNNPPVAVNDTRIVMADTPDNVVDVLANDSDPDGDVLVVTRFIQAVNGEAAFNSALRYFTYTPKDGFSGEDSFAYSISDQHGGSDSAVVTIHVADSSVALVNPSEGGTFQLPVSGGGITLDATAAAGAGATVVRVRFFVDNQLIGQDTTASGNTYSFIWPNPTPGDHVLTAAVVDSAGRQRYSTPVRISISDIGSPTVAITNPHNNDSAQLPVSTGHAIRTITATATAAPGATMSKVKFYVDNDLIGEDTSASGGNVYSIAWSDIRYGEHKLRAVAFDTQGRFKVSNPITVTLTRDANNVPPIAKIVCPDEPPAAALGEELVPRVRRDKLVVRGLAYDPTGQEVTYQVLVTDVDGNIVAKSDPVTGPGVTTGPSTPCADPDVDDPANSIGRVGVVSLTGLLNGRYNANLVVSDQSDVVVETVCFLLESEAKVGHFSFSQSDLSVPVNGIPLRVIRNYNSRNLKSGDFGFSWTYSMLDMDIELDEIRQTAFDADAVDFSDPYSMRVGGSRNVTLTLPNGRRATFRFEPGNCGNGCFSVNWVAAPGVTAKLIAIDKYRNEIHQIYGGFPFVSFESGRTPFQNSDIPGFKLVTQDGTQYILEREDFGERFPLNDYSDEDDDGLGQEFDNMDVHPYGPPFLAEIIQPSGERITFERNGTGADGRPLIKSIEHKSAGGAKMASLAIRRDTEGRINKIFDPNSLKAGLDANGEPIGRPALTYEYDDAGNLWRVLKLIGVNGSTPSYQTYEFKYENPDPRYRHFITKILDGNGRPVAVNEYDDQGRLKRVTDVDGFTSVFDRDGVPTIGVGVETVTDHWGNTRTVEYDAHGNVVLSVNSLNQKVRRVFDNDKNTVSETLAPDGTLLARSDLDIEYFPNSAAVKKVTAKQRKVVNGSVVLGQDIVVVKEFNSAGRPVKIVDRMGSYAAIAYNASTKPDQIQTFNSQGQLLQSSIANHYHTFGPVTGLLDYSEDALGNRHVNSYYNGTEPESGGSAGRLRKVERQDPQGNLLSLESFTYDENGNILTTAKARNNANDLQVSRSFYNGLGQVERTIDPELGESKTTFYNFSGEVESVQDRYGNRTSYLYNRKGDAIQTTKADGAISRSTTIYGYGSNGKGSATIVERLHLDGDPVYGTRTEHNAAGQVVKVEGLKNFRITIIPDGPTYASVFEELPGGAVVVATRSSHYDDAGREDVVTDARGSTITYTYDGYGRRETATTWVTTSTARERAVTTSHYDSSGNDQGSTLVVTRFSLTDPPTQIGSPVTVPTPTFQYDALNRHWLTIHQDNAYSRSTFDQLGRRVEEIEPDGVSTRFEYDGVGRLLAVTKPYKIYNPADLNDYLNPEVTDANPADQTITKYRYDLAGNLTRQTDANQTVVNPESAQKHTFFEYDKLGRRTMRVLPATQPETWEYDTTVANQLVQQVTHTDFNLVSILEEFDNMGRVRTRTPQIDPFDPLQAGWVPIEFSYTATGQRKTMSDASGLTEYEYDDRDRLWRKSVEKGTANARSLTYAYDANDNVENITSSTGETSLTYSYDERNRLKSANGTTYTYDPAGNLQTVTYPNQVVTRYSYDSRNRLGLMTVKDGVDATLASFEYDDYDAGDLLAWPLDRRLTRTGQRQGTAELIKFGGQDYRRLLAYDYDPLKRLRADRLRISTGVSWPSWAPSGVPATASTGDILYDVTPGYSDLPGGNGYDRVGNRRSRTVTDQTLIDKGISNYSGGSAQTFDPNDRLIGGINESDANGNTQVGELLPLSGVVLPSASHKDEYDYENRLIKRSDGITTIKVIYDGDGNRVRKTIEIGSETTVIRYLVDDKNPTGYAQVLEEWQSSDAAAATLRRGYVYGHDLISQRQADGTIQYYGYDGRGNVRLLLNNSGVVTDAYSYDAFGTVVHDLHQNPLSPTQNDYLFSGEQWDPHLGMYFLRARYLNPRSGRFWTMDSYQGNVEEPMSLHKYLYTSANPVNRVDPSGNFDMIIAALSMAADVLGYALNPGREFEVSPDTGFEIDQEELDNADEEALIEIHLASQEWLLLMVNTEVQRGMEAMVDGEDAMWDAFFATWDFNEEVIWDLIESVSYVKACFVAGTPIVVGTNADGSYITRPIEELRQDDHVLSRDENDAQADVRLQRVEEAFSRQVDRLRILTIRDDYGNQTTIRTTDEHPMWTVDRGWIVAGGLIPGDRLQDASGNAGVEVLSSTREDSAQPVKVYNLTVESGHSYFVSDAADVGQLTVWVHNGRSCKNNVNLNSNKSKSKFGVYEIWIDGKLYKIGKADLNRITKSSKFGKNVPTRLHQQLRKKEIEHGVGKVTGKVEEELGETTTASAKAAEKARIDRWVKNGNPVPKGNEKSYRP